MLTLVCCVNGIYVLSLHKQINTRVMKNLKEAFINYRTRTNFDHSEWFDTDNFGTIRLFSPMDYANGEYEEIEVERENGDVFDLTELDNETIELLIDYLN